MLTFNAITHTYNMGKHKTKTCNVCFKAMRSDNFKRHMKKHDGKTEDNIVTKGLHDGKTEDNILTKGPQIRYTDEQFIALKKKVSAQMDEFDRKMELGRNLNKIMNESGYNENGSDNDIGGENLSKKKGKRLDSGCDELSDEESDSQCVWDLL